MAERGDTHYHLPRTNLVFLALGLLLAVCAVWMMIDDWDRDWKTHQRQFQEIEYSRAKSAMEALATPEWTAEKERLEAEIAAVQARLDRDDAYRAAYDELRQVEGRSYKAEAEYKIAKAKWNWSKFLFGQASAMAGGQKDWRRLAEDHPSRNALQAAEKDLQDKEQVMEAARLESEQYSARFAAARERLAQITTQRDGLEKQLADLTRESSLLQTRMTSVGPGVFRTLRDAPALDFVAPTIKVRKQVLPHLRKNYNFLTVQRVDMCTTCHVGADVDGFQDQEQPYASHPRLDLFVSSTSPHPLESFGCTVCHEGAAETTDFVRAVHVPNDHHQEEEWREKHDWELWHLWEWPMLPSRYSEASCYGCHSMGGTLENIAPEAPELSYGLQLVEQYGCYSCHNIDGWRSNRKPGPSLRNIDRKLSAEFARSWIAHPHAFRPSTWMPQIFHLENSVSKEWDDTAIAAIQTYLWQNSDKAAEVLPPAEVKSAADGERGKDLFLQVGCTACHNTPVSAAHDYSAFGPDLAGIGSKVSEDWLYAWILDPQQWWLDTRMPNLRLEPQQAMDIARFLSTMNKDGWAPAEVAIDSEMLDRQARLFLERRYTVEEAGRTLEQWKQGGQSKVLEEVGKQWIARQGCYSCHDIPGFEKSMPIGTDLSDWGNKNVHQLAFELWNEAVPGHFEGAVHPSRHSFAELKLSNPRRFDRGLEVPILDRLRMPDFKFEERPNGKKEVEAITTVLLGLKNNREAIFPPAIPTPDETEQALERGAYLVRTNNCYGCHRFSMDTLIAAGGTGPRAYHGLVSEESEDDEATYYRLWKTDPDLEVAGEGGQIGNIAEIAWQEDENGDLKPPPVQRGLGGGIVDGLANYYVDSGVVDSLEVAFPLVPPFLYREGEKVRAPWVTEFLLAPYTLRPWLAVRMPTFSLTVEEARSIALYFTALARQEWPSRYARELRTTQGLTIADLAQAARVDAAHLQDMESGGRYNANSFAKLKEWGDMQGFQFDLPPDLPFEKIEERAPSFLQAKEIQTPGYLTKAADLVGKAGINCYSCHIKDGVEPGGDKLSWGPDLAYARERLRPDWIRAWVRDAQKIYPGSKMPTADGFLTDPKLQNILKGDHDFLIDAIKDFLMNSDRAEESGQPTALSESDPRDKPSGGQ